jgi:hypothetical protein
LLFSRLAQLSDIPERRAEVRRDSGAGRELL